jgi:hypothetical protein
MVFLKYLAYQKRENNYSKTFYKTGSWQVQGGQTYLTFPFNQSSLVKLNHLFPWAYTVNLFMSTYGNSAQYGEAPNLTRKYSTEVEVYLTDKRASLVSEWVNYTGQKLCGISLIVVLPQV